MAELKSKTILDRKPNLKLESNHFKIERSSITKLRFWDSNRRGTAKRHNDWYTEYFKK